MSTNFRVREVDRVHARQRGEVFQLSHSISTEGQVIQDQAGQVVMEIVETVSALQDNLLEGWDVDGSARAQRDTSEGKEFPEIVGGRHTVVGKDGEAVFHDILHTNTWDVKLLSCRGIVPGPEP